MSYRHTDKPVRPVPPVAPLRPAWPVGMFLITPAARATLAQARAFYARRLRQRAKDKQGEEG